MFLSDIFQEHRNLKPDKLGLCRSIIIVQCESGRLVIHVCFRAAVLSPQVKSAVNGTLSLNYTRSIFNLASAVGGLDHT